MMPTKIYESSTVRTVDGMPIYITPLKIKYLRQFMDAFEFVKTAQDDDQAIFFLSECARIAMQQYHPAIATIAQLEDSFDLKTIYKILDVAAGIKIANPDKQVKEQATDSGVTWETLDLAKLESEVFLLGIWKDYEDLETSLSMQELTKTLDAKREDDYNTKKFLAAIQGVDLDKDNKNATNKWEDMKAKAFSGGKAANGKDILALQGSNAKKAGFGIGLGLSYTDLTKK
jgi:sulfur relay (sulfurtransferase) DsrF/TusC family protein